MGNILFVYEVDERDHLALSYCKLNMKKRSRKVTGSLALLKVKKTKQEK